MRIASEVDDKAVTYRFVPVFVPIHINRPNAGEGIQRP